MCSFFATTKSLPDYVFPNYFQKFRGPDLTNIVTHGRFTIVHNLLSITGGVTPQPFIRGSIAAFFNGEIYNYREFGNFESDGEAIIPLYEKYGERFTSLLDGEFALVLIDTEKGVLIVSTDTFGTKPVWISSEHGELGVASYPSALRRMGFKHMERIPPNVTRVYSLQSNTLSLEHEVYSFDLRQYKTSFTDFITAFEESIQKRSRNLTKKIFLGLSSGYDSGAIACELKKQNVDFKPFTILDGENDRILDERLQLYPQHEVIRVEIPEYVAAKDHIQKYAERTYMSIMPEENRGGFVSDNSGAIGLSLICKRAQEQNYKVLFSGQGADEIFSDYGFKGKKLTKHSSFGGCFPKELGNVFPWRNFFGGTQRAYLDKEEVVAGSYGIETRYPFLDKKVVQEFLSLTPELKNSQYKAPLHEYLTLNQYPFTPQEKFGFSPAQFSYSQKLHPRLLFGRFRWKVRDLFNDFIASGR